MLRRRMRCDAPPFSPADYDHIMQCAEKKPRDKVLKDLTDKYRTSQKRIYQIWRGEEKNRVAWNQPIHMPTASLSNINVVGGVMTNLPSNIATSVGSQETNQNS